MAPVFFPYVRLKTILKELRKHIVSLSARIFLYVIACGLTLLSFETPSLGTRAQVALHQIRQYLAGMLFGRGLLHS